MGIASLTVAGAAYADPCRAIPDGGPVPPYLQPGRSFSGQVIRVLDGDSLCVALGPRPDQWVEVRLVDFFAAELGSSDGPAARAALERVALGKTADCKAGPQSYDRVVAACRIDGRPIGDLLRATGAPQGGRGAEGAQALRPHRSSPTWPLRAAPDDLPSQSFRSCAAARAAGAAPLYRGAPGYAPWLDGDGDGIACEPYRGRR